MYINDIAHDYWHAISFYFYLEYFTYAAHTAVLIKPYRHNNVDARQLFQREFVRFWSRLRMNEGEQGNRRFYTFDIWWIIGRSTTSNKNICTSCMKRKTRSKMTDNQIKRPSNEAIVCDCHRHNISCHMRTLEYDACGWRKTSPKNLWIFMKKCAKGGCCCCCTATIRLLWLPFADARCFRLFILLEFCAWWCVCVCIGYVIVYSLNAITEIPNDFVMWTISL